MANYNRQCLQNVIVKSNPNDAYSFQDGQEDLPLIDEPFKTPPKRKIVSPVTVSNHKRYVLDETELCTSNKFSSLSDHSYSKNDTPVDSDMPEDSSISSNKRIPPIFLHEVNNHQEIVKDIKSIVTNEFTTLVKTTFLKINLTDITDFRNLTAFYDEHNIKFHTFQPIHDKKFEVVIRNVPYSLSDDEIKSELISMEFPVYRVTRLLNKEKMPLPLCFVELEKSDKCIDIFKLEKLCHSIVSVEPKRKNNQIPQCTRCQRYGHTKNFCRLDARCVRCTGHHHFSKCPVAKNVPPSCINCGESHTANFRGCKHYQGLLKSKSSNKDKRKTSSSVHDTVVDQHHTTIGLTHSTSATRSSVSYADVTRGNSSVVQSTGITSSETNNLNSVNTSSSVPNDSPTVNQGGKGDLNLECLIMDLVKSVIPLLKTFIANIISSFIK